MEKLKAKVELINSDVNSQNIVDAVNKCINQLTILYRDSEPLKKSPLSELKKHIEDAMKIQIFDTTAEVCPFDKEEEINHWKILRDMGITEVYVSYPYYLD